MASFLTPNSGSHEQRLPRFQCRAAVGDCMIEQFEYESKSCDVFFVDGAVIVAIECFADDSIDVALHG